MNTYTLPAEVVATLPSEGEVYIAVKGEHQRSCNTAPHPGRPCRNVNPAGFLNLGLPLPPSVLADLDGKQCETCRDGCDIYECCIDGRNWEYPCDRHRDHQGFHDCWPGCCLDCAGTGRALLTVTTECVECGGDGWCCASDMCTARCPLCNTDPRRWTVDGLAEARPPGDNPDEASYCGPATVTIGINGSGRWWPAWDGSQYWEDGTDITVTGPQPTPGDFIVKLTLVTA